MRTRIILASLALLTATSLIAEPAHAGRVSGPTSVRAGHKLALSISVPGRARHCLVLGRSSRARTPISVLVTGARMRVAWRVPKGARSARWRLAVGCGETKSSARRNKLARRVLEIHGRREGPRALVAAGSVRISSGGAGRGAGNPFTDRLKWCTWHAHNKRPDIWEQSVANGAPRWGWDAHTWSDRAVRFGHLPTGTTPVAGAIAVYSREYYGWPRNRSLGATYGHVAYVESVDATGYTVSEHSGDRRPTPNVRRLPTGQPGVTFIYGGPAGNGPGSPPAPSPTPAPAPTPAPGPPRKVITVDNRVTNGAGMREDTTPARLLTKPWILCGSRGCNINGTERGSGGTYDAAVCQTFGERTTNGHDGSSSDDANPELFSSTRYYGVRLGDGTFGYVSEVWIRAADRGGLGLPAC
jgi:surface antigen